MANTPREDRVEAEEALAEAVQDRELRDEGVRPQHVIIREGPRWRLAVGLLLFIFLVFPPALTIGYIKLDARSRDKSCDAVARSNEATIDFLRQRVPPDAMNFVEGLNKEYQRVAAQCRSLQ